MNKPTFSSIGDVDKYELPGWVSFSAVFIIAYLTIVNHGSLLISFGLSCYFIWQMFWLFDLSDKKYEDSFKPTVNQKGDVD